MKRILVVAGLASAVVMASPAMAFAGERGGSGEPTPVNSYTAKSICAFSGLDDMDFEAPVEPGVVQSFGQEVRWMGGPVPGAADVGEFGCNANLYPTK